MSLRTGIELQDNFSDVLNGIIYSMNEAISTMSEMQQVIDRNISAASLTNIQAEIASTISAVDGLQAAIMDIESPVVLLDIESTDIPDFTEPVQAEVETVVTEQPEIDMPDMEMNIDDTGIQALNQQVQQTEMLFQRVLAIQQNINSQSQAVRVLPDDTAERIQEINANIEQMQQIMHMISENPFQMNSQAVEQQIVSLTNRLHETLQEQQQLQDALSHMNMENEQPPPVEIPQAESELPDMEIDDSSIQNLNQQIQQTQALFQRIVDIQQNIDNQSQAVRVLPNDTLTRIQEIDMGIEQMSQALNMISENPFHMNSQDIELQIISLTDRLRETLQEQQQLQDALSHMNMENEQQPPASIPRPEPVEMPQQEPVEVPIVWQTDSLEVFTNTGIERFQQEVESANSILEQLNSTQDEIASQAYDTDLFPPAAFQDLNELAVRINMVRNRIQQITNNPINMGTDIANTEIESLRSQLEQAVQEQNELNAAMDNMDISAANAAYVRLSQTIANTERYIRDNTDEQGQFNNAIEEAADSASDLNNIISGAVGVFHELFGISKIIDFVSEGMESFDSQLNAETQLMSVLANMLDDEHVTEYMLDVTADTSEAIDEINTISDIDDVVVTVDARVDALQAEFDTITAKADEISSKGIYGGDALIAGAAELSTYFTDTGAIEMMMDTLSNYAMGMSGGGELDSSAMVEYATGLGKIMSGAYDAMTKKGFEFSDVQQAIIDGTAEEEQIAAVLGEEYLDMSQDMQAAAVITQVIDESWAGLYETMSNTPESKIIQMTSAWGDMKQMVAGQLYPYIMLLVDTITENWDTVETIINGFTEILQNVSAVIDWLIEGVVSFASFVVDNWSVISPIVMGAVTAIGAYTAALLIGKAVQLAYAAVTAIHTAMTSTWSVATFAATLEQEGLNAALAACPITWIIIGIIALIAIVIALCNWIASVTDIAQSGIGIIVGALAVAAAFVGNLFVALINMVIDIFVVLWNFIAVFVNFFGNVFTDPINSIARMFFDLVDGILELLQTLAGAIDTIFGSSLADSVQGWRDDLGDWVDDTFGKGKEIMAKVSGSDWHVDRFEYDEAWDAGVELGDGIAEAIDNFNLTDALGLDDKLDNPEDYKVSAYDYAPSLDGMGSNLNDIADDTDDISDSLEISEENLKYLRDLAEQEAVNRFTTAEITIEQNNTNNIKSEMDLDGVISGMTDAVSEAINITTEGVH